MRELLALSVGAAFMCGIWTELAVRFDLLIWGGFAGCTAFFAAGGSLAGMRSAVLTTISGVIWAQAILWMSGQYDFFSLSVAVALVTFCMCFQSKIALLGFIPGTFLGAFSTFANQGDYLTLVPSLLLGVVLGYLCERTGEVLSGMGVSAAEARSSPDG